MLDDPNTRTHKNAQLFIMASLSPTVQESLDLELYRTHAESDEADIDYILTDAFRNLLKDVETIGLTLKIDPTDYCEDMTKLAHFLQLMELLLPNRLYPQMKTDANLLGLIQRIIQGSISGNETTVQTYLTELGGLDGSIPYRPHLVDIIDTLYPLVHQTPVFTDYLIHLVDLLEQEQLSVVTDHERMSQYQVMIREMTGRLSDAVNLFEDDPDYAAIVAIQHFIIKDLSAPENFIPYAYLFLEKPSELPDELVAGYQRKWLHYFVSHRWCYTYYTTRHITEIPRSFQLIIWCFMYSLHRDVKQFEVALLPFSQSYPDPQIQQAITALYHVKG